MSKTNYATPVMTAGGWKKYHPFSFNKEQEPLKAKINDARLVAKKISAVFTSRFSAEKVVLFGSLARGDFTQHSDIDLAVWAIPPADFYRAVAFASGFSKIWKVDVVDAGDCPKTLLDIIHKEGIFL